MSIYSNSFYTTQSGSSLTAGRKVIRQIVELFRPHSLLDIGCGAGPWVKSALEEGIDDAFGVDGKWAKKHLVIPAAHFASADLSEPFDLRRRFDIVITLEVAEHLPAEKADVFVDNVVKHTDLVAFTAAIPFQGGTHHVNEQWPAYWRAKFAARGFNSYDFMQWRLWNEPDVLPWYKNMTIFANKTRADLSQIADRIEADTKAPRDAVVIHPDLWLMKLDLANRPFPSVAGAILRSGRILASKLIKTR